MRIPSGGSIVFATNGQLPSATTSVSISPGWNLVGSPYSTGVAESGMKIQFGSSNQEPLANAVQAGQIAGTVYTYSAGATAYSQSDISNGLLPFTGYWLYSTTAGTLTFASVQ